MKPKDAEERPGVSKVIIAVAALVVILAVCVYAVQIRSKSDPTLTAAPPSPAGAVGAPALPSGLAEQKAQAIQEMARRVFPMANTGYHKTATPEGRPGPGVSGPAPAVTASR